MRAHREQTDESIAKSIETARILASMILSTFDAY
jgi:hypothetical protein